MFHRIGIAARIAAHRGLLRLAAILAHGERDALALDVDLDDTDLHDIARFHHLMRILDETIGKLGDVDQAILMHADIDEGAEGGDIGDGAFERHADLEIGDLLYAFGKGRGLEGRARVAAGLFEFGEDVLDRRETELLVDEALGVEALQVALSPISERRSRPQAATIFFATP